MPTLETENDYYAVLGVDPGADSVTIRKAVVAAQRRWGARQNAPDLATRQEAERYAQVLTEVRDALLDPGRRALYDIQRVEALPAWPDVLPPATPGSAIHSDWSGRIASIGVALVMLLLLATRASTGTLPGTVPRLPAPPVAAPTLASLQAPQPVAPELASPSPLEPTQAVTPRGQVFVADTDGEGVFLSSTPNRGDRLTAWPDGSQLEVVGDDVSGDGLTWASVRAADGQIGFVPRQYLSANPPPQSVSASPPPQRAAPTQPPASAPTRPAMVARSLPDEVPVTLSGTPLSTSIVPAPTQPFSLAGGRYSIAWSVAARQPCDFVITIADPITPALVRTTLANHVQNRSDGQPAQGQTSVNLNSGKYRLEAYSDTCTWTLTLRAG
jgi:hypothetical protein